MSPLQMDDLPFQRIINVHWGEEEEPSCSEGGGVTIGVTHEFGTLVWDKRGQIGYCFLVHVTAGAGSTVLELLASVDPDIPGSTAWRLQQTYPDDPGAAAALTFCSILVHGAVSYIGSIDFNEPTPPGGWPDYGPFGQGTETQQTCCNFAGYEVTCYPAAEPGNNPEQDTDTAEMFDFQKDICETAMGEEED